MKLGIQVFPHKILMEIPYWIFLIFFCVPFIGYFDLMIAGVYLHSGLNYAHYIAVSFMEVCIFFLGYSARRVKNE